MHPLTVHKMRLIEQLRSSEGLDHGEIEPAAGRPTVNRTEYRPVKSLFLANFTRASWR